MNVNLLSDEELADKIKSFDFPIICEWKELPKPEQSRYLTLARFIRQCVKNSRKELIEVLKELYSEGKTTDIIKKVKQALASVEEKDSHVA